MCDVFKSRLPPDEAARAGCEIKDLFKRIDRRSEPNERKNERSSPFICLRWSLRGIAMTEEVALEI